MKQNSIDNKQFLRQHGLRNTSLINAIIEVIRGAKSPLDFNALVSCVTKRVGYHNKTSFYRNIIKLKERGIIFEIDGKKFVICQSRRKDCPQIVISCVKCDTSYDYGDSAAVDGLVSNFSQLPKMADLQLISLKGVCSGCEEPESETFAHVVAK